MKTIFEIGGLIKEKKGTIMKYYNVIDIGIFGSYIHDEQQETSDIDILVRFEHGHKDLFNFIRLKNYLEKLLGIEVDLVYAESIKPRLKEEVLNEVQYV